MIARSDMLLLGVGGGGGKVICSIVKQANVNFKALVVDTDANSSREAGENAIDFLLIGRDRLLGQGTGGDVASGRVAADDDMKKLDPFLNEVRLAVVVVALGSGTGGGATPKILQYLSERGITTLCFATMPFECEGYSRVACAASAEPLLSENADTFVSLPLDKLYACCASDNLHDCTSCATRILGAGISLIWRLMCLPGFIQLDSEKLRTLIVAGQSARLGFAGSSQPINRAAHILEQLASFKLLGINKNQSTSAQALLVGIVGGDDLLLSEIKTLMDGIKALYKKNIRIEMGTVQDTLYNGRIDVVLFAFEQCISMPVATNEISPVTTAAGSSQEPPVADVLTVVKQTRKAKGKGGNRLSVGPSGRGKFQNCEPTIYNGVDLDVPTYLRYGLNIEK